MLTFVITRHNVRKPRSFSTFDIQKYVNIKCASLSPIFKCDSFIVTVRYHLTIRVYTDVCSMPTQEFACLGNYKSLLSTPTKRFLIMRQSSALELTLELSILHTHMFQGSLREAL